MAVLSVILGVLPVVSPIAPLLGAAALLRMRQDPRLEGRLLAWAGIVVGTVVTAGTYGGAYYLARSIREMADRPAVALRAAMAGDASTFRAQFTGPATSLSAAGITGWADALHARFGALEGVDLAKAPPKTPPAGGPTSTRFEGAYVVRFARATIPARVLFELPSEGGASVGGYRLRRIVLEPEGEAAIVFPDDPAPTPGTP
jgi:hypothetical protein